MSELPVYEGEVEGVLRSNAEEILQELVGVIEAAQDKSIRLTKSGIPPKPLWGAVNERLLWKDPKSILYDWDEVDQVRFIYSLAMELCLVQPNDERVLDVGPGADQFYLAAPHARSAMLLRAYLDVTDWDERCDARNDHGHRHNFGQTFRRDFLRSTREVRDSVIDGLQKAHAKKWTLAEDLAVATTVAYPDLLISEDDDVPVTPEGEADTEVARLVGYWLVLAARFGWVDLARTPADEDAAGQRVFRITPLGRWILAGTPSNVPKELISEVAEEPFVIQPNGDIVFYRNESEIGDEYLVRRIASDLLCPDWAEPVATYHATPDSVRRALETGLDPDVLQGRLIDRSRTEIPPTFRALLDDALRHLGKVVVAQGLSVVELAKPTKKLLKALAKAEFSVFDKLAIVPWRRWHEFVAILGTDIDEGFRYPSEEPLGKFSGQKLELEWPVLPMIARDLFDTAGVEGDPPVIDFAEAKLGALAAEGWTPRAIAEAVTPITAGVLPKWLQGELD